MDTMIHLQNTYSSLPKDFHRSINPTSVKDPKFLSLNKRLLLELGIDNLDDNLLLSYFSGNSLPKESIPLSMTYAGHQFGNFVPQLGDGRAILLGELTDKSGKLNDIQLKGSGPTAYSRQGDGRSAIGPVIREYIISEAMHAMNIPTTRALAAVSTGENVQREGSVKGGILTRVANSHIRVGTFEFFRAREDYENLKVLADYVMNRLYPEISEEENKYLLLFKYIARRQSTLISKWMSVGFIHGVMNTDNFSISGETIDYGPCAFIDEYDPETVFSSIDRHGRYKFSNQPNIALWNLSCLAGCLLPIIDGDQKVKEGMIQKALEDFAKDIDENINIEMTKKIGLNHSKNNHSQMKDLLKMMRENKSDFTLTFRSLAKALYDENEAFLENFIDSEKPNQWLKDWKQIITKQIEKKDVIAENLKNTNPIYIPRNHLIEKAISEFENEDSTEMMNKILQATSEPYIEQKGMNDLSIPPKEGEKVTQTFCGT